MNSPIIFLSCQNAKHTDKIVGVLDEDSDPFRQIIKNTVERETSFGRSFRYITNVPANLIVPIQKVYCGKLEGFLEYQSEITPLRLRYIKPMPVLGTILVLLLHRVFVKVIEDRGPDGFSLLVRALRSPGTENKEYGITFLEAK